MVEMKIGGVGIDPKSNLPVVLLKNLEGTLLLPIWIGMPEAGAIAVCLEGVKPQRPLTHDLIKNIFDTVGVQVLRTVITEVKNNTYYARLVVKKDDSILEIDSRPSDAMAIALRHKVPIFVKEEILKNAIEIVKPLDEAEAQKLKKFIHELKPDDFWRWWKEKGENKES
jgi:hypothetical protein